MIFQVDQIGTGDKAIHVVRGMAFACSPKFGTAAEGQRLADKLNEAWESWQFDCLEDALARLALQFRASSDPDLRRELAGQYEAIYEELCTMAQHAIEPEFDSLLPDGFMPQRYEERKAAQAMYVCPGCSRLVNVMQHKWCPAYGTSYYMSGTPLPEGEERSPKELDDGVTYSVEPPESD